MAKQNAYSIFVYETARDMRRRGEQVNQQTLFKDLGPTWQSLSAEVKNRYKERASSQNSTRDFWNTPVGTPTNVTTAAVQQPGTSSSTTDNKDDVKQEEKNAIVAKQTSCDSNSNKRPHENDQLALVEQQAEKKVCVNIVGLPPRYKQAAKEPDRYKDINLFKIRAQCDSIVRARIDNLLRIPIYSFSVNVLCKHKQNNEDIYVPIELSIYAYSLKKGKLGEPYHVLIDAGDVPLNCVNQAADHATYHKITFPHKSQSYPPGARNDYKKIYKEILEYTKDGERTILLADARDLAQATGSLEWLYRKATEDGTRLPRVGTWTVLPAVEFVATMFNLVRINMLHYKEPMFALHYYIRLQIDGSALDYNTSLMCDYHSKGLEGDHSKWCAQSCAARTIMNIESILESIYKSYCQAINLSRGQLTNGGQQPAGIVPFTSITQPPQPLQQPSGPIPEQQNNALPSSQPILAIEAPPAPITNLDPRLRGRAQPEKQISTIVIDNASNVSFIEEPQVAVQPAPTPRKPKEPLIIVSNGAILEHPPDIF